MRIGTGLRIAIVHARWNTKIIDALVSGAVNSLISTGVSKDNIVIQTVPGSYELPVAVQKLVHSELLVRVYNKLNMSFAQYI